EGCGPARGARAAHHRGGRDRSAGAARGADPHRGGRGLPLRSALHRGQVPLRDAGHPGPRGGGHGGGGGRAGRLRPARRPGHHLPVGLLRPLRDVPERPPGPLHEVRRRPPPGGGPPPLAGRDADPADVQPLGLRRADARPRARRGQGGARPPLRAAGADRLRRDDRAGRGAEHGARRAGEHGGGHRLRRDRPELHPGRADRRGGPHHRHRHRAGQAGNGARVRRDRRARRRARRRGRAGARPHRRRGRLLVRGDRREECRRAGLRDAGTRRHRHDHRHDPGGPDDRAGRRDVPGRAPGAGERDGLEPLPHRHAALHQLVPAGAAEAGRAGDAAPALGRDQPRLRGHGRRARRAQRDHVRL
ncbi:MAG: Alcohol dehydrogenase, partial [uncultured Thermomicrobiales bacterium]